jgi:hypothetical protein
MVLASARIPPTQGSNQVNSALTIVIVVAGFLASLATVLTVAIDIAGRVRRQLVKKKSAYTPTSTTILTAKLQRPNDLLPLIGGRALTTPFGPHR